MSGGAPTTMRSSARRPRVRGAATPFYLHDRAAPRRIRELIPQARLIVIVRDPVERAHSCWTHLWSAGLEPINDVVRACAAEEERVAAGWNSFWQYVSPGKYGKQLQHLYPLFPRDQVLVLCYKEIVDAPVETQYLICAFLEVKQGVITELPKENVTAHLDRTLTYLAVSPRPAGSRRPWADICPGRLAQLSQTRLSASCSRRPGSVSRSPGSSVSS